MRLNHSKLAQQMLPLRCLNLMRRILSSLHQGEQVATWDPKNWWRYSFLVISVGGAGTKYYELGFKDASRLFFL